VLLIWGIPLTKCTFREALEVQPRKHPSPRVGCRRVGDGGVIRPRAGSWEAGKGKGGS